MKQTKPTHNLSLLWTYMIPRFQTIHIGYQRWTSMVHDVHRCGCIPNRIQHVAEAVLFMDWNCEIFLRFTFGS